MFRAMKSLCCAAALAGALSHLGCRGTVDKEAARRFQNDLGNTSITVFPTVIHRVAVTTGASATEALSAWLRQEGLAATRIGLHGPDLPARWSSSQSKMFNASAKAVAEFVKTHPIETPYAMQSEYLIGGGDAVLGIHDYVVNADGLIAGGRGVSSHHREFREVSPTNVDDCTRVLQKVIRRHLRGKG